MDSFSSHLTAAKAYCLDLMGVTRWQSTEQMNGEQSVFRPSVPWGEAVISPVIDSTAKVKPSNKPVLERVSHVETAHKVEQSKAAFSAPAPKVENPIQGFATEAAPKKMDVGEKEKTVNNLREELYAAPEVIVEDLQPIEEFAVAIEAPKVVKEHLPKAIQCCTFLADNRLLIISDMPVAFKDEEEVEKLAGKMAQALLKKPIKEWQSSTFRWPSGLKNPHFLDRTDWMIGAFESFIESQLKPRKESETAHKHELLLIVAGRHVQKLLPELADNIMLKQAKKAEIVSIPELYRIPEYKAEAWTALQKMMRSNKSS